MTIGDLFQLRLVDDVLHRLRAVGQDQARCRGVQSSHLNVRPVTANDHGLVLSNAEVQRAAVESHPADKEVLDDPVSVLVALKIATFQVLDDLVDGG